MESNPHSTFKNHAFPNAKPHLICKMNYSVNIPRGCFFSFLPSFPPPSLFFFGINCATETEKAKSKVIREYSNIIYDVYRSGWELGKKWEESLKKELIVPSLGKE